jgi:hypothetical protein
MIGQTSEGKYQDVVEWTPDCMNMRRIKNNKTRL